MDPCTQPAIGQKQQNLHQITVLLTAHLLAAQAVSLDIFPALALGADPGSILAL